MRLDKLDLDILEAADAVSDGRDTFRPWRGSYGAARNLAVNGYLKEAGICAMPPHVVYVITDFGREQLRERRPAH